MSFALYIATRLATAITLVLPASAVAILILSSVSHAKTYKRKDCLTLAKKYSVPYKELSKHLPTGFKVNPNTIASKMLTLSSKSCKESNRSSTIKTIIASLNLKPNKTGILLSQSGPLAEVVGDIRTGIESQLGQNYVFYDAYGQDKLAIQSLAKMLFTHDVNSVIGGLRTPVANALLPWANRVAIPFVLLNDKVNIEAHPNNRFAFIVFPSQRALAGSIAANLKSRNLKRIGMLAPSSIQGSHFMSSLEASFKSYGISIAHQANYTANQYTSMESAARTVFQAHPSQRQGEYRRLAQRQRRKARKAGIAFSARMISLPPISDFDALFIADHFKNVRHFIKIFKYLGVKKIPLLGHQSWRARGLVDPFDDFLENSFFVDLVGDYLAIPKNIPAPSRNSKYFLSPVDATRLDLRIIGARAGEVVKLALKDTKKKRLLPRTMSRMKQEDVSYYLPGNVFDESNRARWPTFTFAVRSGSLVLQNRADPQSQIKSENISR